MNTLKLISFKNFMNFHGFIILCCALLTLLGLAMDSQALASEVNLSATYLAPFQNPAYILGTDGLGRSVAYGLLNGIKISLSIAVLTALLSLIIALFFSYLAGYLGDNKLRASFPAIVILSITSLLGAFYLWNSPSIFILIGWVVISYLIIKIDNTILQNSKKLKLPLDGIIMKYVTLQKSLPGIFFILFILGLSSQRGLLSVIAIITFARIPYLLRLSRSEVLKVKNQEFVMAAESMGIQSFSIFTKHILPNILTPIRTHLIYTLATTILIESTLSFLGLGLSEETVSLGSMLSSSRDYFSAWWLAILPGGIIFLLIYSIRGLLHKKVESEDYAYL